MDQIAPKTVIQRRRRRRIAWMCFICLFFTAAIILSIHFETVLPAVSRKNVWIGTVHQGDLVVNVRADGELVPAVRHWLTTPSRAEVARVMIHAGDHVSSHSVLMILTNQQLQNQLLLDASRVSQSRASLAALRARLAAKLLAERATLADSRAAYASADLVVVADAKAAAAHVIPTVQYRQNLIALKRIQNRVQINRQLVVVVKKSIAAQLAAGNVTLQRSITELRLAKASAAELIIHAGLSGIVQQVTVQEGQRLAPGAELAQISDPRSLLARLYVTQTHSGQISIGMLVELNMHPGIALGTVSRINPNVNNGMLELDVSLRHPNRRDLRVGESVDGRIRIFSMHNVLWISRPSFATPHSVLSVFRVEPNGKAASRVLVRFGAASISRIQVLSGLQATDRVLLSGVANLGKFERIRLR